MKTIGAVKLLLRSLVDESVSTIGTVELPSSGQLTITLDRDEMGGVFVTGSEVIPDKELEDTISETQQRLSHLHASMGNTQIAAQHALTALFLLGRYING